tara:strand:- start:133 stop:531 length:399 start_codon:yes stop_codon:yes gene_type:complete
MYFLNKIKASVAVVSLSVLLAACSHDDPALYWAHHPEQLKNAVLLCRQELNPGTHCQQIQAVYEQLAVLAQALASNPEAFGQRIMGAQSQLAQLKARLKKMHGQAADDLREQIHQREKTIALMLAIAGDAGE